MPFSTRDDFSWDTITLQLTGGVDLRAPARGVEPPSLLRCENTRFEEGAGVRRRRGHRRVAVRDDTSLASSGVSTGGGSSTGTPVLGASTGNTPDAGPILGMAKRDDEVLAWNGSKLFSYPPSATPGLAWQVGRVTGGAAIAVADAVMPAARTRPVARPSAPESQTMADSGVGSTIAAVAYRSGTSTVKVCVYDPATWSLRAYEKSFSLANPLEGVRVVACGDWVHVIGFDSATAEMRSFHVDSPGTARTQATLGTCEGYLDVRKLSDSRFVVVKMANGGAELTYFRANGSVDNTYCSQNTPLGLSGDALYVAVGAHPTTGDLCVAYTDAVATNSAFAQVFTAEGVAKGSAKTLSSTLSGGDYKLAVEAVSELSGGEAVFIAAYDDVDNRITRTCRFTSASAVTQVGTRFRCSLQSQAFRTGNAWFVLARNEYDPGDIQRLQHSWFVLDANLEPVGRLEYGLADTSEAAGTLPSVHPDHGDESVGRARFHGLVRHRNRVDSRDNDQFDEVSLKRLELDFQPRLCWAQLGRTTYFAGAQLHAFDGRQCIEAGVHLYPENLLPADNGAGNLGPATYEYKAVWARRTHAGEEVVSAAVTSTTVSIGANRQIRVSVPTMGFSRAGDELYLLLYRREATGTLFYLVSSRDPSTAGADNGYVANNPATTNVTLDDDLEDSDLLARERFPGDAGVLAPFSPPASEVVAAGRDRLWLAGGELPAGDLLPSLQYTPGFGAAFNQFLQTTVDRGHEPITAVGFMGNSTLVFKRTRVYSFEADGPSNLGVGAFDPARVVLADTGATHQNTLVLATSGLLFQSPAGIQLLAPNYQLVDVGAPVAPQARTADVVAAVLVPEEREVRFYRADGPALVLDYSRGAWATWTGLECEGAVLGPAGGAVLAPVAAREPLGAVWVEDTAGRVWADGGRGYEMVVQFPWVGPAGGMGLGRVRTMVLTGDHLGDHQLRGAAFYDERPWAEDEWTWDPTGSGDLNDTEFGDGDWGDGTFGDTDAADTGEPPRDRVYELRHRMKRQKCARFSLRLSDGGRATAGPSWTAVALEVGKRGGLRRSPVRTLG